MLRAAEWQARDTNLTPRNGVPKTPAQSGRKLGQVVLRIE